MMRATRTSILLVFLATSSSAQFVHNLPLGPGKLRSVSITYRATNQQQEVTRPLVAPYIFDFPSTSSFNSVQIEVPAAATLPEAVFDNPTTGPRGPRLKTPITQTAQVTAVAGSGAGTIRVSVSGALGAESCSTQSAPATVNTPVSVSQNCPIPILWFQGGEDDYGEKPVLYGTITIQVQFPNGGVFSAILAYDFPSQLANRVELTEITPDPKLGAGEGRFTVRSLVNYEAMGDTGIALRLYDQPTPGNLRFRAASTFTTVKQGKGTVDLQIVTSKFDRTLRILY